MFKMPTYKERISLIPWGCPQLLDFEVNLAEKSLQVKRNFLEISESGPDENTRNHLHPLEERDGEYYDSLVPKDEQKPVADEGYTLYGRKILDQTWLDEWIPVPFFCEREQLWEDGEEHRVEYGPTNWSRVRFTRCDGLEDTYRIVLAFDMRTEEPIKGERYRALAPEHVSNQRHFRLAWQFRDNAWFLNEQWIDEWLKDIWLRKQRKRKGDEEDERQLEYAASYLTLLNLLHKCIGEKTRVYIVNPSQHKNPIDVDLVLDIGNSRTTGILVETRAQSSTNLNNSYLLQLRDMDEPDKIYTDPFETRVEFSEICFGNDAFSRKSGRTTPAFVWPSPVRIGPEAARLSTLSRCSSGATGMSSPKRYLWDERDREQSWRFNIKGEAREDPYVTRGPLAEKVNASGTPLCCMEDRLFTGNKILRLQERESAFESNFTRSSLMMFLFVEVIQQALLTVNSPGQRARREAPDVPRRLRQVIFTVPSGMPIAEQRIYRRWAKWAVRVLWDALGWADEFYTEKPLKVVGDKYIDYRSNPIVRGNWDEATCTQLVYIFNEISRKFQGDAGLFCQLAGRRRTEYENRPCVRVATIDVGGGTTDLSITTFELQSDPGSAARMAPHCEFHDGFNLAGDDILRAVVSEHVLHALAQAMKKAGIQDGDSVIATLFGRDLMDNSEENNNRRAQFVRQVAVPVALCILSVYEQSDLRIGSGGTSFRFRDCFSFQKDEESNGNTADDESGTEGEETSVRLPCSLHPAPSENALRYVDDYVSGRLGSRESEFHVLDVPIHIDSKQVDATVSAVLKDVFANLCEVISLYECDALLLTGRPSRWQGIVNTVFSLLPVAPDRIIPMGKYRVGNWYPFADSIGNITDPKTTVVVGAILCTLAEGQLEGFSFYPYSSSLTSTARFIGEMENNGQIKNSKVWFTVDVTNRGEQAFEGKEIIFGGPISIGFRQLDVERWTTTRFYCLDYADAKARNNCNGLTPLKVKLSLIVPELDESDSVKQGSSVNERDEGEFTIEEVLDKNGNSLNKVLEVRLQTLPRDDGFWLDTGIVRD